MAICTMAKSREVAGVARPAAAAVKIASEAIAFQSTTASARAVLDETTAARTSRGIAGFLIG
jgi:hypothetical protein